VTEPTLRTKGERNPEATRNALLDAAGVLFAAHGYDGASVDEICAAAGVNKAMVSYHFHGKDGLYQEVLRRDLSPLAESMIALRSEELPPDEKLRRFIRIFGGLHAKRPALSRMVMREILSAGRHLDATLLPRFVEVFRTLMEIIEAGCRSGVFRRVDPMLTHQSITGALVFFFVIAPFRDRILEEGRLPGAGVPPSAEEYIRHVETLILRGLAAEEPSHA
jgi:TetR/AcrR family transcriptional regulator